MGASEKPISPGFCESMTNQAQGGTLYLHEIDHLDIEAQELIADFLNNELKVNTDKNLFNGIIICSTRVSIEDRLPGHICSRS